MTRVNLVPPSELTREHLIAEYREISRLSKHAHNKYERCPDFVPPPTYRMGKGHMDFFVDKGLWVTKRFNSLVREMNARGYITNFTEYRPHPEQWMKDWEPSCEEIEISRQRIRERLQS